LYAAKNYQFKDKEFEDLCDLNAKVCLDCDKFNTYKDWLILKALFKTTNNAAKQYETLGTGYRDTRAFNVLTANDTPTPVPSQSSTETSIRAMLFKELFKVRKIYLLSGNSKKILFFKQNFDSLENNQLLDF